MTASKNAKETEQYQADLPQDRLDKLKAIRAAKINPYPYKFENNTSAAELAERYATLPQDEQTKETFSIAGRLITIRDMGKICFAHLQDQSGRMQLALTEQDLGKDELVFFSKHIDMGDIVGVKGPLFRTKKGELSIKVKEFTLLTKSLRPLADKFHGLKDPELIYRNRSMDLITNEASKKTFVLRSQLINRMRRFLDERKFLEVETPILQNQYGGASARPFTTHHNALDMDLFLRISPELYLKRLVVGGLERVYDFNKNFRNEGIDYNHNPEFSMIEIYQAYADYNDMMELTESLIKTLAREICGKHEFTYRGKIIDLSKPFKRVAMVDAINEITGIDCTTASEAQLRKKLQDAEVDIPKHAGRGWLTNAMFEAYVEETITQPTFIIDHPKEVSPLTKIHRLHSDRVERFELFIAGDEFANAYSELNDPIDQRERFVEQVKAKELGDDEAQPLDEDFLQAIELGLPPTGGLGIGVDRLVMLLTEKDTIRDVILFPTMKAESNALKNKQTMVAVALLNKSTLTLEWEKMNTVAHLNAALGARLGKGLFMQERIHTKDNHSIALNIQHAIMIKHIENNKACRDLIKKAKEAGLEVTEFTREMILTTDDKKVIEMTKSKNYDDVEYLGVLVFGKKSAVDELTKVYPLYK